MIQDVDGKEVQYTMTVFPGTTVEVSELVKGSSKILFDGLFAAGGITLSQISAMTGLEPYMIQNWVKRGFITSPVKRLYSREQFAGIIIINMLKESLNIDRICSLIDVISGPTDSELDDLIRNNELYHMYVDMLSDTLLSVDSSESIERAARCATEHYDERIPGGREKLVKILTVMFYAHSASLLRRRAEESLSSLQ